MRFVYPPISFHNSKGNRNNLINTLYEQLVNNFRNFYSLLKKENEFFYLKHISIIMDIVIRDL